MPGDLDLPNYSVAGASGRWRDQDPRPHRRRRDDARALTTVQAEASLADVTALMKSRGIKCLPVLKRRQTRRRDHPMRPADFAHMLGPAFGMEAEAGEACDVAIKNGIRSVLRRLEMDGHSAHRCHG